MWGVMSTGATVEVRARRRLERSCPRYSRAMAAGQVRMWRPKGNERVLLMAGQTTQYAVDPRGEYVLGIVTANPMRARRGRRRHLVVPGDLVAWDPSAEHAGTAVDAPWSARLIVVEVGDLAEIASDHESELPAKSPLSGSSHPRPSARSSVS